MSIDLSSDRRWLVSSSQDQIVRLWDMSTGVCEKTFLKQPNPVTCVAFDVAGQWLVMGGLDQAITLWDVASSECLQIFEGRGLKLFN